MKDYRLSHTEERIARQYEEVLYKEGSYDDMLWKWEQGVLAREVGNLRKTVGRVDYLDFGCGTGRILLFLENLTESAVGVDNAEAMLMRARARVQKAEIICADITQTDVLVGQQFDLITVFRIFLNAQPMLRDEMCTVLVPKLRDENSLFIFNIHGNLMSYRLFSKLWYMLRGRRLNTMTVHTARKLAEQHGLEVVRWYGFGVQPKFLYRWLGSRFMFAVDTFLSRIPGMKYVSYDLVFVCRQARKSQWRKARQ